MRWRSLKVLFPLSMHGTTQHMDVDKDAWGHLNLLIMSCMPLHEASASNRLLLPPPRRSSSCFVTRIGPRNPALVGLDLNSCSIKHFALLPSSLINAFTKLSPPRAELVLRFGVCLTFKPDNLTPLWAERDINWISKLTLVCSRVIKPFPYNHKWFIHCSSV